MRKKIYKFVIGIKITNLIDATTNYFTFYAKELDASIYLNHLFIKTKLFCRKYTIYLHQ